MLRLWLSYRSSRPEICVIMSAREQPDATAILAQPALPAPFVVDQGALRLDLERAHLLRDDPAAAVVALAAAHGCGLYVGRDVIESLAATPAAAALKHLAADARGALLRRLVSGEAPALTIDAAQRAGLLRHIVPEVGRLFAMPKAKGLYKDVYLHTLRVLDATPDDLITRLAALLHDIAKPDTLIVEDGAARFPNHDLLGAERAERRLRALQFEPETVAAVATLVRLHLRANSYEPNWTDSAVRRLRLDAGDQWMRLLDLSYADVTSARREAVARAQRRVQELDEHARALDRPVEVSPLDGNALMAHFGRGPGRWIGAVKQDLIERVREGTLDPNDEQGAWEAAARIVESLPSE
jgi:poly(A) polymerase